MANPDPWSYAAKTASEHAEQTALFMWANVAVGFGITAANDPLSYSLAGHGMKLLEKHYDTVPELEWLYAIPNQGTGSAMRGAAMKAEGLKAGVPDLFLPVPKLNGHGGWGEPNCTWLHGFYIELKRRKSTGKAQGKLDLKQIRWHEYLRSAGYAVQTIVGWELARDALLSYLGRS